MGRPRPRNKGASKNRPNPSRRPTPPPREPREILPRLGLPATLALTAMLLVVVAAQVDLVMSEFRKCGHIHPTRPFAILGPAMAAATYWA